MNKLDKLTRVINSIRDTTNDILKDSIPILKQLDTDKRIVEHLVSKFPTFDKRRLRMILNEAGFAYIEDAKKVRKELDDFANKISENEELDAEKTPYLASVWHGDMYDVTGLYALAELEHDFNETYSNLNAKTIVNNAILVINEQIEMDKTKKQTTVTSQDDGAVSTTDVTPSP